MAEKPSFSGKFLNCKINKRHRLGTGSYATVYEAIYEELPCAAKVLHRNLFEIHPQSYQLVERFEQECKLLSKIRHPCIVQFLGVARDPGSRLPILVMELMEDSLTKFLERTHTNLPFHLQVNFCRDVALALAYLHSCGITHRDLSSNNVLLIAGTHAKVTDFGTSVFKNEGSARLTSCPGTQPYMAPECFGEEVQYSQSVDCFSFGVLVIQIITRQFPNPSARLVVPPRSSSLSPRFEGYMRMVPEVDRRQDHIHLVDRQNPLRNIFMECLKNNESARPTARDLCHSLVTIKENSPLYKESIINSADYQFSVMKQYDALIDEFQSNTSELTKARSEIDDFHQKNLRLKQQNQSLEKQVNELSRKVQELEVQNINLEEKHQRGAQGIGGFFRSFSMFGDRDRELESKKTALLKRVLDENALHMKRISTLETELEQKRQIIASKDGQVRQRSDELKNTKDKLDSLEVDLSLERVKKIKQLEETIEELEESKVQRDELEEQLNALKHDQIIQETSYRQIISHKDKTIEAHRREIDSLNQQLKKLTKTLDKNAQRLNAKCKRPKHSPVIVGSSSEEESSEEAIHRLDLDRLSSDSDKKEPLGSLEDDSEKEYAPVDDSPIHPKKSLSSESSNHSKLELYTTDSDSESIHTHALLSVDLSSSNSKRQRSGNYCSGKEEFSEDNSSHHPSPKETSGTDESSYSPTPERSVSSDSLQVPRDQESDQCDKSDITSNDSQCKECTDDDELLSSESTGEQSLGSEYNIRSPITETTEQNQAFQPLLDPPHTEISSISKIQLQSTVAALSSHKEESQAPNFTGISRKVVISPVSKKYSDMAIQTMPESETPSKQSDENVVEHSTVQVLQTEQQSTANGVPEGKSNTPIVQSSQLHSGSLGHHYPQSTIGGQIKAESQPQSQTYPLAIQVPHEELSRTQLFELLVQHRSFLESQLTWLSRAAEETAQDPATVAPSVSISQCTIPSHSSTQRNLPQHSLSDTQNDKMSDRLQVAQKDGELENEQSLSANHGEPPQASDTQIELLESYSEQQPRVNQAQQSSMQIFQSQVHQTQTEQPSDISINLAVQSTNGQQDSSLCTCTSSVGVSESPVIETSQNSETTTQSQLSPITQSPVQMLPTAIVCNQGVPITPQNPLQNKRDQQNTSPPIIDPVCVQQKGALAQRAARIIKEHVQSPDQDSSSQPQQALIDKTTTQTISRQPQMQLPQSTTHTGHTIYLQCKSSQGTTTTQQGLYPSSFQASKPQALPALPILAPVHQPTCRDLRSNSLPTLPEEAQDQFHWQEIACSQHPMQPPWQASSSTKQQMIINDQWALTQQPIDTEPITNNKKPSQNLMIDSQQTNVLEKTQPLLKSTNASCKGKEGGYPHIPIDRYNNEVTGQTYPGDLKASMTNTAPNHVPSAQMHQHMCMQSGASVSGNTRHIPFSHTHNTQVTPLAHPPHNQSNMQQAVIPPSTFKGMQSVPSGNVPPDPDHYGAVTSQQPSLPHQAPVPHHHYYSSTEEANNVSYQGSLSDHTSRGATRPYYEPHQNQGSLQSQNSTNRVGQSHAHPTGTNSRYPTTTPYGQQSSISSEESSISSLGNQLSSQLSFDSQQSSPGSKQHQHSFHWDQEATALGEARHPVLNHGQMAGQQMHTSLPSGQQGSGITFPSSRTHAYVSVDPEFPHLAAERQKAQYSHLGSFSLPHQSLQQQVQSQRPPPPDRRQYHQSGSVIYPRNFSEPNLPQSYRDERRPYPSHRPSHTAPQIFIVQPPYEPYQGYGSEYGNHHIRYTEQHYPTCTPEYAYGYGSNYYNNGGRQFGQQMHREPDPYRDPYCGRNPSVSSNTQLHRQTSSRSNLCDSSVLADSPRSAGGYGPAECYPFISQQKNEELIQVLGTSKKTEEYSVVLIQPLSADDLSSSWTATFAVCRRHPNCINALLRIIQGPSGSKYNVAHISVLFDSEGELSLDIPYDEAKKQGYTITSDVSPCSISKSEATPPSEGLDRPHADAVYPPRHTLTIFPHNNEEKQRLSIKLKLLGAKDCVRHFVLTSPSPLSAAHQNATKQFTSMQHTTPPIMEQSDILQSEPDVTKFLHMVGNKISLKWRALGAYLGVLTDEIQKIAHTIQPADPTCCLATVIEFWKDHKTDRPPTWNDLITAVKQVDEPLALTIRHQLISNSGQYSYQLR